MIGGILVVFHVIVCIGLVLIVLIQSGKSEGLAAAFGGGGSTAVLGTRTGTFLTKVTTGLAILFTITSLLLSVQGARRPSSVVGPVSPAAGEAAAPAGVPAEPVE